MKSFSPRALCAALALATIAAISSTASAAPIVTLLGNSGTLTLEFPPNSSTSTLTAPYGALPTPVTLTNGIALQFVPTSAFMASVTSTGTSGRTSTMDGKLDLLVSFDTPVNLAVSLYEDGGWTTTGSGTVDVKRVIDITEYDHVIPLEQKIGTFTAETYTAAGGWSSVDQLSGFTGSYYTYKISIDNTLLAEALLPGPGSAYIAKKNFTLVLTTDGGGQPNVPEPASLGVLALGGLALLARRRKA